MMDSVKRNYQDCGLVRVVDDMKLAEERDRGFVEAFCRRFNLRLIEINQTFENGNPELMYVFDDDFGGYSISGIIGSLM